MCVGEGVENVSDVDMVNYMDEERGRGEWDKYM